MVNKLKPKSEFSSNVLTLMTGTTIAQAIPIAISPILTRIYTPEDFGVFALFVAITAIFGSITNGRYELAIILPKKDEDAINIFALGFIITAIISLMLLILVILFKDYFTILLGNEEIGFWLYLAPLTVLLIGVWNLLSYLNNRKKYYKDIARATIIKAIVTVIVQLSIGFIKNGATGLISGQILSQLFANTKLFRNIITDKLLLSKIRLVKIIALAKRYKDFPKYSTPVTLLDVVSSQAPIFILSSLFVSNILVGHYSFANRMLQFPMGLIGSSIAQVFYQSFSQLQNNTHKQMELLLNTWKKLFLFGLVPFSIIFFFGENIFSFVFGANWSEAGKIASLLSPMLFIMFISSPTSSAYIVLDMQKIGLYFGIFVSISRPLSLYGGYLLGSIYNGFIIMVVIEIVQIIIYNFIIIQRLRRIK